MLSDDHRIGAEASLPRGVGEDHDAFAVRYEIRALKEAPLRGTGVQHRKEILRHVPVVDLFLSVRTGIVHRERLCRRQSIEGTAALPPRREIPGRDIIVIVAFFPVVLKHADEAVRLRERQRLEQHAIHGAEDRRVGADPDCQRENRGERKAGRCAKRPEGVSPIGEKAFEVCHMVLLP